MQLMKPKNGMKLTTPSIAWIWLHESFKLFLLIFPSFCAWRALLVVLLDSISFLRAFGLLVGCSTRKLPSFLYSMNIFV